MGKWQDVGYVGFTKAKNRILIVVKHQRFVCDLQEIKEVLNGERDYTLIFEPPTKEETKKP